MLLILQATSTVPVLNPRYTVRKPLIPLEGRGEGVPRVVSLVDRRHPAAGAAASESEAVATRPSRVQMAYTHFSKQLYGELCTLTN